MKTLMRFALCEHCGHRDRYPDDADGIGRMCNGCGHFESCRFIGVTDPEVEAVLAVEFPVPTVDLFGVPVVTA